MSIHRSRTRSAGRRDFEVPESAARGLAFGKPDGIPGVRAGRAGFRKHVEGGHAPRLPRTSPEEARLNPRCAWRSETRKGWRKCTPRGPSLLLGGRCDGCQNPSLRPARPRPSGGVCGGSSGGSTQERSGMHGNPPSMPDVGGPVTGGPRRSKERRNPMRGGTPGLRRLGVGRIR